MRSFWFISNESDFIRSEVIGCQLKEVARKGCGGFGRNVSLGWMDIREGGMFVIGGFGDLVEEKGFYSVFVGVFVGGDGVDGFRGDEKGFQEFGF